MEGVRSLRQDGNLPFPVNVPRTQDEETVIAVNAAYVMLCAILVFAMQIGFAMLTAGSVRTKNVRNVLLKNVCDAMVSSLAFFFIGFGFAFGDSSNRFIGYSDFALNNTSIDRFAFFFFMWTFCATAVTIVSGSVCERISFYAYITYSFVLSTVVFPIAAHWIWDDSGWLSGFRNPDRSDFLFGQGAVDFAGCTVVHIVGGFSGLLGSILVGPRIGRFDSDGKVIPMPGHSATLCALGAFILWFGWFGFNSGSALGAIADIAAATENAVQLSNGNFVTINQNHVTQRCLVNTVLSASAAGLTTLVVIRIRDRINDLLACLNGMLAGCVAITASCSVVEPWHAVIIGAIGAVIYVFSAQLLLKLGVDDPLEAFAIHGIGGIWGELVVGAFATEFNMAEAGYNIRSWGFLNGGGGRLFGANLVAIMAILGWTCTTVGPFFLLLKFAGILRISEEEEIIGNDFEGHGGYAYPEDVIETTEAEEIVKEDYEDSRGVSEAVNTTSV